MAWVFVAERALVAASAALIVLAALAILFVRPGAFQNRALALVLMCEGIVVGLGEGLMYMTDDPRSTFAFQVLALAAGAATYGLYPLFFSTLDNPLSARMRRPPVRWALGAFALALPALVVSRPALVVERVVPARSHGVWDVVPGPLFFGFFLAWILIYLCGIVFALLTLRRATGAGKRAQARHYLIAFGWRDVILVLAGSLFLARVALPVPSSTFAALAFVGFVPLLAYGILKAQLFDIDLKIKKGISRGTVVAIFAGVFFVVGVIAENYLSSRYGYLVGGGAAGILLLALAPLQRFGHRVANTAMPRVRETSDYVAFRKLEVYKAALEGAMQDGSVSEREREVLRRLRASLGIADEDANALERDLAPTAA